MDENVLMGMGHHTMPLPRSLWQRHVTGDAQLDFMTADHHRVRNFVVLELPRARESLSPGFIAEKLELPVDQVVGILEDLEVHMTFLYRDELGAVEWAYPVTTAQTPHRVTFSTGERINAA